MIFRLLGTAAGGGVPQWNCGCSRCATARTGSGVSVRTQDGAVVGGDGNAWALLNASPDLRAQLLAFDAFAPTTATRKSPILDVVLSDAELDHVAGLLLLREAASAVRVHATAAVLAALTHAFPVRGVLEAYTMILWNELTLGTPVYVADGAARVTAIPVGSKRPRYAADVPGVDGWVSALRIDTGVGTRGVLYAPCVPEWSPQLAAAAATCDCVVFDGTFWSDDEMIGSGWSSRTAREMGHLPIAGSDGALEHLHALSGTRCILTHLNNSNPLLHHDAPERDVLEEAGIEVGVDGQVVWCSPDAAGPPARTHDDDAWRPKLARGVRLAYDSVRGVDVLLAPENVVRLNVAAAAALQRCDGVRRIDDIVVSLRSAFAHVGGAHDDVASLLGRFRERGWVT